MEWKKTNKQRHAEQAKKNAKRNPEISWNKTKQGIRRETEWIRTVTTTEHWATQTHYGWLDRFVESGRQYTSSSKLVLGSHPSVSMYFNIAIVFVFASQSWNEIPTTALQTVEDWKIIASTHSEKKEWQMNEMTKQNARKLNQSERIAYGRCATTVKNSLRNGALHKPFFFSLLCAL